ncbi:MAG: hypothetical protein GXP41_09275 [Chloroflexi bacterium]|nr:hypothetical protein [Chloroflexota bacterium]
MFRRRWLRGVPIQLLLWTTVPLTLAVVILAAIGVVGHQRAMRDLVQARDSRAAQMAAGRLADRLRSRTDALTTLAGEVAGGEPYTLSPDPLATTLFKNGVAVVDPPATILMAWPAESNWTPRVTAIQSLISPTLNSSLHASPVMDDPVTGKKLLLLAQPAGTHWVIGAITLGELDLQPLVSELAAGTQVWAAVVDGNGRVLAASGPSAGRELSGKVPVPGGEAGAVTTSVAGNATVVAYAPVKPIGWALITQEPWDAVVGPLMRFSLIVPLLLLLATLAAGLTVAFGLQSIVRPLQQLDRQAVRVAWGDFDAVQTPVGGTPEIEDLRQTLHALSQQIRQYQQGMRDYIGAITRGQEEERKRLARELHDDTIQSLIALGHRVEMARRQLEHDPQQAVERLDELKDLIHGIVGEVRRFTRALRPIYLEDLGLLPALEMLVRDLGTKTEIEATLHITGTSHRLTEELELTVYRLAQEALGNVAQHSEARHTDVRLHYSKDEVALTVADDGVGFDVPERPEELAQRGHFGLVGMRERAALVGGRLKLTSSPEQGTQVVVTLPAVDSPG